MKNKKQAEQLVSEYTTELVESERTLRSLLKGLMSMMFSIKKLFSLMKHFQS